MKKERREAEGGREEVRDNEQKKENVSERDRESRQAGELAWEG